MTDLQLGSHAAVIGASVGGLAAAAALARFFDRVTVLDRDDLPATPVPRASVPQGRHLHLILAGGLAALEELCPGFRVALTDAGAVPLRIALDVRFELPGYDPYPQRDLNIATCSMTRPVLEGVLRDAVARLGTVTLRSRTRVLELLAAQDGAAVTGLRVATAEGAEALLDTDLVVDASGRGAPTLALLDRIGVPPPETTEVGIDIAYSTQMFAIPPAASAEVPAIVTHPIAPASSRAGMLFPIENGRWIVTLAGMADDKPPGDHAGFLDFAAGLRTPTIHNRIKDCRPLGEVTRFGFPASVRRHFDRMASFPAGLLPFGDSLCRFNPLYGQGMSVRAQEALLLRRHLAACAGSPQALRTLAPAFLAEAQTLSDTPWLATVPVDLLYPHTTGERPEDHAAQLRFGAALRRLAAREEEAHRTMTEVLHLLRPRSAFADPALQARVRAVMAEM